MWSEGKDIQGWVSVVWLELLVPCCIHTDAHTSNSTFVHQCTHHECVKWGYYCHIAGRLAAPVLITLLPLELQALPFYPREFWQPEVCKLSSASNFNSSGCHSRELQLGSRAQVHRNKAFLQRGELTNSQGGRRVFVKGRRTFWKTSNRPEFISLHPRHPRGILTLHYTNTV